MSVPNVDEMVTRASSGDEPAWRDLWDHVEDVLEGYVGSEKDFGAIGKRVVDRRNIIREVMERLRRDGMQRLHLYLELRSAQRADLFEGWLRVLARRVAHDYARERLGRDVDIDDHAAAGDSMRIATVLVHEPALSALELWTQGASYREIARELDMRDAGEAERVVRGALEVVQRGAR